MTKRRRTVTDTVVDIITVLMIASIIVAIGYAYNYAQCHYTSTGTVIDTQVQRVYVEDTVGNVWCYEAKGDVPSIGSTVELQMCTNSTTKNACDDEIVEVVVH